MINPEFNALITYIAAVSVAVERCVEMTKNLITLPKSISDKQRVFVYQLMAVLFSLTFVGYICEPTVKLLPWYIVAILTASGSGVWNTALQTMTGLKEKTKETK